MSNQKTLARTLETMNKTKVIQARLLPDPLFPNGFVYFEKGARMIAGDNPCTVCVLVHNNWIVGQPAKKYRFKEHLLWHVDKDHYYSCPDRKYMMYDNPTLFGTNLMFAKEDAALRSAFAIAHILNRTLILPRFHCQSCKGHCDAAGKAKPGSGFADEIAKPHCYIGVYYNIAKLDGALPYRESVFLQHPLVPESTKSSVSPVLKIVSGENQAVTRQDMEHVFVTKGRDGASKEEIVDWFARYSAVSVIHFQSLYDTFSSFKTLGNFGQKLKEGLIKSNYRQY